MAVELATAYVSLVPSARNITAGITRELSTPTNVAASKAGATAGKTFGSKFGGVLKAIGPSLLFGGLVGAAVGITKVLTGSIDAATESMKVTKDTEAVIKSMGGVANISAAQVANLSMAISKKTGVDDEAIQVGQNLLLTFGNIRNEVGAGNDMFNRASAVIVDFAARFKTDIPGAARLVGKALNDPIKGLTSLTRVGVQFTDSQKAQIKAMVDSGNIMGAQQIIMAELRRQTEGSAVAQATAADKMRVAWGNLQEQIGAKLLPVVEAFSTWMTEKGIPFVSMLMERFDALSPTVKRLVVIGGGLVVLLGVLASTLGILPIAIAAVAVGVIYAYNHFETFRDIVDAVVSWFTNTAIPAIQNFAQSFTETFTGISESVSHTMNVIQDVIGVTLKVISFLWNTFGQTILGYVRGVWQTISGVIGGHLMVISGIIKTVLAVINGDWGKAWEGIKQIAQGVWTAIRGLIVGFLTFITAAIDNALTLVNRLWSTAWDKVKATISAAANAIVRTVTGWRDTLIGIFSNAITWLLQAGRNIISGLWSGIKGFWDSTVAPWFRFLSATVMGFLVGSLQWLVEGGKNIIRGLWTGIKRIWSDIVNWFKDVPGKIKSILGIASPPKWAIEAGRFIMKGLMKGLGWGAGKVMDYMGRIAGNFTGTLRSAWDTAFAAVGEFLVGGVSGFGGLVEPLASKILAIINASGGQIRLISGRRSSARQAELYAAYAARGFTGAMVARPGTSNHERGLAADLGGPYGLMSRLAHLQGLIAPVPGEPWHWELPRPGRRSLFEKGSWNVPRGGGITHPGEMVLPARLAGAVRSALAGGGAGGSGTYVAPGAVVIGMPPGATLAEAERLGGAAGRSFLEVLARRRIVTDARIA